MADGQVTQGNQSYFIPEIVAAEYLDRQMDELVGRAVTEDLARFDTGGGTTIDIPGVGAYTAKTYNSESTDEVVAQYPAQSRVQLVVNTEKEVTFDMPSRTALAIGNEQAFIDDNIKAQAEAIAEALDSAIVAESANFTLDAIAAGTHSGDDFVADMLAAIYRLNNAKVVKNDRVIVVGPMGLYRIQQAQKFTSSDYVNEKFMATGAITTLMGMPVYLTQNIPTTTVSSVTTEHCMMMHKTAIGYRVRRNEFRAKELEKRWATSYQAMIHYGTVCRYPWRGVRVNVTVNL